MNKEIGDRIKYHRNKQNITQSELADGIISISYLSKIENGTSNPPEETIYLLCKKLGIDQLISDDKQVEELADVWFQHLYHRKLDESKVVYKDLKKYFNTITNTDLLYLIEIHKLRYYTIHDYKHESLEQFKVLKSLAKSFRPRERYYWKKFTGNFYFVRQSYRHALDYFEKAEVLLAHASYLVEEEQANLYYMKALSASFLKKSYITYEYTNKALDFYQKKFMLKQTADCHILFGITFLRTKDFKNAMESFTMAETIAKTIDNKSLQAISIQNIGNVHSLLDQSTEAVKAYRKSYALKNTDFKKLVSVGSLIKEYYKRGKLQDAKIWLEKGLELIGGLKKDSVHTYEIKVYHQLILGDDNKVKQLILDEVIPYLDNIGLEDEKVLYFELLADIYFKNRKYKLSAEYYKCGLHIKKNI